MREAWIIDAARTPRGIGRADKGALASVHPQRILSTVLKALGERNGLKTSGIDDVIIGCFSQTDGQGGCIARQAVLDAGWGSGPPGFTVNRYCGSGLTAVNQAVMGIWSGAQDLVVGGGVEQMSSTPSVSQPTLFDCGNLELRAMHAQTHQGICADLIATMEGISREELDSFALESQRRAAAAIGAGAFDRSTIPVLHADGSIALDREEYNRPGTTMERLASLKPAFDGMLDITLDATGVTYRQLVEREFGSVEISHVHHGGNSSGIVDGAGAVVLASPEYARANGLKPRARIRAIATAGGSPELMLKAPVPAARKALQSAGMTAADIDLFEINEAFAIVPMIFMRELGIDHDKVNVVGGAIALGHPIGATGAMLVGTVLDELERRDLATGLVSLCTGGGMAPAAIIERI
ncbi:acetyl-CoA C-acetyltransferase [Sphingopyxis sp. MSC1_008]|jgi:acetyl-CoA C-acetyltransferase|uniref:acetyl-CoA C-acetyltransferase n=1 Tax=Sphingopyxis sp. MSC1_008 TaxID=2909265 RepID=UPI0020C0603B|nr:acetyl-CoA C-acetyltransferase [Sphingopyxis sp. MSC1_008]